MSTTNLVITTCAGLFALFLMLIFVAGDASDRRETIKMQSCVAEGKSWVYDREGRGVCVDDE